MKISSLFLALGSLALIIACSQSIEERAAVSESTTATLTLQVTGMTWGGCVSTVQTALEGLDGVSKADVSLEEGTAIVTYDKDKVNEIQLVEAVSNSNPMFEASVAKK